MDTVFAHFSRYITPSDTLKSELAAVLEPVHFSKGELVLDAERTCTRSYFIRQGMLRAYFLKGKDETRFAKYTGRGNWRFPRGRSGTAAGQLLSGY